MKKMARKYDKRITIRTMESVPDGYGGVVNAGSIATQIRWAMVEPPKQVSAGQYRNDFGLKGDSRILKFYFRNFDFDIKTQILVYAGVIFTPLAVESPDQYNVETVIVAEEFEGLVLPPVEPQYLILEDDDYRLLENDDRRLLENSSS